MVNFRLSNHCVHVHIQSDSWTVLLIVYKKRFALLDECLQIKSQQLNHNQLYFYFIALYKRNNINIVELFNLNTMISSCFLMTCLYDLTCLEAFRN